LALHKDPILSGSLFSRQPTGKFTATIRQIATFTSKIAQYKSLSATPKKTAIHVNIYVRITS